MLFASRHLGCANSDAVQIPAFEWLRLDFGVRATEDANLTGDGSGTTNDLASPQFMAGDDYASLNFVNLSPKGILLIK